MTDYPFGGIDFSAHKPEQIHFEELLSKQRSKYKSYSAHTLRGHVMLKNHRGQNNRDHLTTRHYKAERERAKLLYGREYEELTYGARHRQ